MKPFIETCFALLVNLTSKNTFVYDKKHYKPFCFDNQNRQIFFCNLMLNVANYIIKQFNEIDLNSNPQKIFLIESGFNITIEGKLIEFEREKRHDFIFLTSFHNYGFSLSSRDAVCIYSYKGNLDILKSFFDDFKKHYQAIIPIMVKFFLQNMENFYTKEHDFYDEFFSPLIKLFFDKNNCMDDFVNKDFQFFRFYDKPQTLKQKYKYTKVETTRYQSFSSNNDSASSLENGSTIYSSGVSGFFGNKPNTFGRLLLGFSQKNGDSIGSSYNNESYLVSEKNIDNTPQKLDKCDTSYAYTQYLMEKIIKGYQVLLAEATQECLQNFQYQLNTNNPYTSLSDKELLRSFNGLISLIPFNSDLFEQELAVRIYKRYNNTEKANFELQCIINELDCIMPPNDLRRQNETLKQINSNVLNYLKQSQVRITSSLKSFTSKP